MKEMQRLHDSIRPLYSDQRREFMDLISYNLTPNVLIGFNLQELLPPHYQSGYGPMKPVNPLFKAFFFDRLLQEGGLELVSY